jgi:3-phosphoshikimate 1-carboxyvinyltransferase
VLQGTVIKEEEVAGLQEELPALAIAGALAAGTTVLHRTPESADCLDRIAHNLRPMGVAVSTREHGIEITGSRGAPLQPGCVPAGGDARIAMAFATAGLFAEGETIVEDVSCVHSVYPAFADDLRRFQERSISGGSYTPMIAPVPATAKK